MIASDDKIVDIEVYTDNNIPNQVDITILGSFDQKQISNYRFYIVVERGFWRDEHQIFSITDPTVMRHEIKIISNKIKNDDGSIRFYATEDVNGVPVKRFFSKKMKLGYAGGSSSESLLSVKFVDNLPDLLYFVDVLEDEPVLLIHQEAGEKYAEKYILGENLFKAGILPDILADILFICFARSEEISGEVLEKWIDFFNSVSSLSGNKLDGDCDRNTAKESLGKFLSNFKYREIFINKVLEAENESNQ